MPVVRFEVVWPDGKTEACYSPSSVIKQYFIIGKEYSINEFLNASENGLQAASNRVLSSYGYPCSNAMNQLSAIKARCADFVDHPKKTVTVTQFID